MRATFLVESGHYLLQPFDSIAPDTVPHLLFQKVRFKSALRRQQKHRTERDAHQNLAMALSWTLNPERFKQATFIEV